MNISQTEVEISENLWSVRGIGHFAGHLLTPQLQNVDSRKSATAMVAKLEMNSGWSVIKPAHYLCALCSQLCPALLQTSKNCERSLARRTQGRQRVMNCKPAAVEERLIFRAKRNLKKKINRRTNLISV